MNKFLVLFRFGTVPYHMWFLTKDKLSAVYWARSVAHRRNTDVPSERTEIVAVFEIDTDRFNGTVVNDALANEIILNIKIRRDAIGAPHPHEIDESGGKILYQPITG